MKLGTESLQEFYRRTFYPNYVCDERDTGGFYLVRRDWFNGSVASNVYVTWYEALAEFEKNIAHAVHIVDTE